MPDDEIPEGARCASLRVPVDYNRPDGAIAALALIRFPATGAKIGSLVVNPGGPGASGVRSAIGLVDWLPEEIRRRFDLIGFDPRGVGSSTPSVRCNSDADNDARRADPRAGVDPVFRFENSPAGVEHIEAVEKQFAQRCADNMGKEFLANVGTANVARDLDRLRAALGDDKLNYLGYSYGTLIGSAYAEAYPDKVRAMILDGVVDPNRDPVQNSIDQAAGFQTAFDDYAADCAKDLGCPLGTDPVKAVVRYRELVDPLMIRPARTDDPRGLSYNDALLGTVAALYSARKWRDLTSGLAELENGRGDTLLALADGYWNRDAKGRYGNMLDANTAVNCVDKQATTDRAVIVDLDRRLREVAPFISFGPHTGQAPLDGCAFWPVPASSLPHEVVAKGLPPVLVVSTTHDPATPYKNGVNLARQLGATLLSFNGTQHTIVFQGQKCIDDYAVAYLVNLTLPPSGTTC